MKSSLVRLALEKTHATFHHQGLEWGTDSDPPDPHLLFSFCFTGSPDLDGPSILIDVGSVLSTLPNQIRAVPDLC